MPMLRMTKIVSTHEEGEECAKLLGDGNILLLFGHGAVTASTNSVEQCVSNMATLEHQARLNYLALAAGGTNHGVIPEDLAQAVNTGGDPDHIARRVAQMGGVRRVGEGGVWAYYREIVSASM
jgi:ribulose-5-phosphate 4-epimerase/fuculose-1-phosphate aldolase